MATFRKRGDTWRVEVKKAGRRESATFQTKAQAQEWAARIESEIACGMRGEIPPGKTLADLLDRYQEEISAGKKGARWEEVRIAKIKRDDLAAVKLTDLNETHVVAWRDRRIRQVSAASVRREWTLISHACTVAIQEWKWLRIHPMKAVRRPAPPPARNRLITQEEVKRMVLALGRDYDTATARVGAAFLFSLETAMRCGEICSLRREDVSGRVAHLADTKNGHARDVPLSTRAIEIINAMPAGADTIFDVTPSQVDALFRKAKARALLEGFTFHDARATALTRLAKILTPFELAKVSGHRDLRILLNTYYRESAETLAAKLG